MLYQCVKICWYKQIDGVLGTQPTGEQLIPHLDLLAIKMSESLMENLHITAPPNAGKQFSRDNFISVKSLAVKNN